MAQKIINDGRSISLYFLTFKSYDTGRRFFQPSFNAICRHYSPLRAPAAWELAFAKNSPPQKREKLKNLPILRLICNVKRNYALFKNISTSVTKLKKFQRKGAKKQSRSEFWDLPESSRSRGSELDGLFKMNTAIKKAGSADKPTRLHAKTSRRGGRMKIQLDFSFSSSASSLRRRRSRQAVCALGQRYFFYGTYFKQTIKLSDQASEAAARNIRKKTVDFAPWR